MDVTCEHCQTEYEFDDALVSNRGRASAVRSAGIASVKRKDGGSAGGVDVRTVDGQALEFRALRELKARSPSAASVARRAARGRSSAQVGLDRRLEPSSCRHRRAEQPPHERRPRRGESAGGRGRCEPSDSGRYAQIQCRRSEHSVAIRCPARRARPGLGQRASPRRKRSRRRRAPPAQTFKTDHGRPAVSHTRELHALGEPPPPVSLEPATMMEPDRFRSDTGPSTIAGVPRGPGALPHSAVTRTAAYGTPLSADAAGRSPVSEPPPSSSENEPTLARRLHATPPPPPVLAPSPTPPPAVVAPPRLPPQPPQRQLRSNGRAAIVAPSRVLPRSR
jgi:hypothetical protein